MPPDAKSRQVEAWLRKARNDLRNIDIVLPVDDCPLDTVAFHAQQAAEKSLKAALTFLETPFPRVHDLEEIAALLPGDCLRELDLDPDNLALLSELGVAPRYPVWDDEVERADVEHAVDAARRIHAAVLDWLKRHSTA